MRGKQRVTLLPPTKTRCAGMDSVKTFHVSPLQCTVLLIAPFLAVTLTACADSAEHPVSQDLPSIITSTVTTTVSPEQNLDVNNDQSSVNDNDNQNLHVTSEGAGVLFLRLDNNVPSTDAANTTIEGKLISGPGGCLSVQPGGRPELLIFNTDTRFSDHPPQVTLGEKTIKIGERFSLNAIEVSSTDLTGIPDKCSNGAADRAWIVGTK
ncbi:Hypothetical protein [Corynebacterium glutamicum ATCC 13032]|uniref:Uncharacterized protein n=2 Tax=Corynebacterium glutamicum TaxID=1718 RepID=Q8NPI8_CORGL|nr:Hypothetical protein [Corynebacterium glutamicum ATCC 13032]